MLVGLFFFYVVVVAVTMYSREKSINVPLAYPDSAHLIAPESISESVPQQRNH